jgi:hypothetical protein
VLLFLSWRHMHSQKQTGCAGPFCTAVLLFQAHLTVLLVASATEVGRGCALPACLP